jgi:hypothetical protein
MVVAFKLQEVVFSWIGFDSSFDMVQLEEVLKIAIFEWLERMRQVNNIWIRVVNLSQGPVFLPFTIGNTVKSKVLRYSRCRNKFFVMHG